MYFGFVLCIGFQGIFQLYNVIFIYVLFLKQTRKSAEAETTDQVLNKKVPYLVFMQNQTLQTNAFQKGLERDDE